MHELKYIRKIDEKKNIFGDDIAYIEKWDFSRANINDESRVECITKIASICYNNPKAVGRESLYNRLKAESLGLPSSSFEFVPVLMRRDTYRVISESPHFRARHEKAKVPAVLKYGEFIPHNGEDYLLTNFRALLSDSVTIENDSIASLFNTEEECEIIKKYSNVFMTKMDIVSARQHNRHRISLQELSRRYVNGKKEPIEIYLSDAVKNSKAAITPFKHGNIINPYEIQAERYCELGIELYLSLIEDGVPAEEARRVIPIGSYTKIWSAFLPSQLENYYGLRLDSHAQEEIRKIAKAMKEMENE